MGYGETKSGRLMNKNICHNDFLLELKKKDTTYCKLASNYFLPNIASSITLKKTCGIVSDLVMRLKTKEFINIGKENQCLV